jgi:Uma2 family endonuclease
MRMGEAGILTEDDPVELIHGQIVKMSPENSPHRICVAKVNQLFVEALSETDCFVQPQSTLPLDAHNAPEPDLAVLRGTPDALMEGELPVVLAVEVADSSLERDRDIKQSLYAAAGIPVYWIVNLQARTVEVYTEPEAERYRERTTRGEDETVSLPGDTDATIPVHSLLPAVDTDE